MKDFIALYFLKEYDLKEIMNNETRKYPYDAVVVLGGGLHKQGDKYYPTDYRHNDEFGILGAGIRIVAAVESYLQGHSNTFVFSTGITAKNQEKFGKNIPTEAEVYKQKFLRVLASLKRRSNFRERFQTLSEPGILLEDKSFNTFSNIQEVLRMAYSQQWDNIALISSQLHIPRVTALFNKLFAPDLREEINIDFMSAEDMVKNALPGKYDLVIGRYLRSPQSLKRLGNEQRGIIDLASGRYVPGEFQLHKRDVA